MTVNNQQLFRKAAEDAKRFNKREPLTERIFALAWKAAEAWVVSQFDLSKGATFPNFGRLVWVGEPGCTGRLQPCFVLLDSYAKSHSIQCGRGAHLASTVNRGWQVEPSEDMNFSKLAIRFSEGLSKDVMFTCIRILINAIGDILATGQVVEIKMGVGALKGSGRKVEFAFDSQYARGRNRRVATASRGVPRSVSLPGSRPISASSRPSSRVGAPAASSIASTASPRQARAPIGPTVDWSSSPSSIQPREGGDAKAKTAGAPMQQGAAMEVSGVGRAGAAVQSRQRGGVSEDVGSLLLHVPVKPPTPTGAITPGISRPYGTDLDVLEDDEASRALAAGRRPARVQQRRQFGAVREAAAAEEEARKGKRTGNFGSSTKALESAAERHSVLREDQTVKERSIEAAMNLRRMELDDEAQETRRRQRADQLRLASDRQGQVEAHHAQRAAEDSSRRAAEAVALISDAEAGQGERAARVESYRNELDYQVMEKALHNHYQKAVEQQQDLSMIADAEEDLVNEYRTEQSRVAAAREQMKADWSRQQQASRGDRRPSARAQPRPATSQEAARTSVLSPW